MAGPISLHRPLISAVVCTYNRAVLLRRALDSLANQSFPPANREIILVDDGSTDDTRKVAAELSGRIEGLITIHQRNAGLGAARNAGWRAARAPLIAFLDDDAIAPPDWLESLCAAFSEADSRVAGIGGPIDPDWETPPPPWLTTRLSTWVSAFDLGAEVITSAERPLFFGANMAFRRTALEEVGGFAGNLGRRGSSLLSQEESALWSALAFRGYANRYLPRPRVRHFVPSERLQPAWFRRRLFWEGISIARQESWPAGMPRWRRVVRWLGLAVARARTSVAGKILVQPWRWPREVAWQIDCFYSAGLLREKFRLIFK